jgi:cell division protein ZapA (FtsZ GTPase activity inhibitor)
MAENKKTTITVDDKEYNLDDMNETQHAHINHITDLDRKINTSKFNLDQLVFGRQAFVDSLKTSLAKE